MEVALADGDELARAWEMVRDLGAQLADAKRDAAVLSREMTRLKRAVDSNERRWSWIETENAGA